MAQYSTDLATAIMCHKALLYIWEKMNELKTSYPDLNRAMTLAVEGYVRDISVECPKDTNCKVTTEKIGGIPEILAHLETAIEWLTLELQIEEVPDEEDDVSDSCSEGP